MISTTYRGKAFGVIASLCMLLGARESMAENDSNFSRMAAEKGYSVLQFDSIEGIRAQSRSYEKFGMRLADLEVYESTGGASKFIGVWEPGTGLYKIEVDSTWTSFESKWWSYANANTYRLKDVERVKSGTDYVHYSLYRQGSGVSGMYAGDWSSFTTFWNTQSTSGGLRLIDVDVKGEGTSRSFLGTFAPGSDAYVFYSTSDWTAFQNQFNQNKTASLELIDVNVILNSDGTKSYTGVWRSGGNQGVMTTSISYDLFKQDWVAKVNSGYRLIDLGVSKGNTSNSYQTFIASYKKISTPNLSTFNPNLDTMGDFLQNIFPSSSTVEGMSYAISRNGQVVRAGSTGNALRAPWNASSSVLMTSQTHQGLASVTKMLTAPLVHRLLRLRGLTIDSSIVAWLPTDFVVRGVGFGGGGADITFKQLLTHTAGISSLAGTNWSGLKTVVQLGAIAPSSFSYANADYALLKVIIPALRSGIPASTNAMFRQPVDGGQLPVTPFNSTAAWNGYSAYMKYLVATIFNIPVTCDSANNLSKEAFIYRLNPTRSGVNWSTSVFGLEECGGHQGLRMSSQELVQYWDRIRYDDTIVNEAERNRMRAGAGMMASWPTYLRIGSSSWHAVGHNGYIGWGDSSGEGDLRTCLLEFPGDVTAALILNSVDSVGSDPCQSLRDAYVAGVTGLVNFSPITLQAESATWSGASVSTAYAGYLGSGFVDTNNSAGNWIEFNVNNIPYSGVYQAAIRYSNLSGSKPLNISVNGAVENTLINTATGSWSSWSTVNVNIPLIKGNNKLRLTATGPTGAAMIDQIVVSKVAISKSIWE